MGKPFALWMVSVSLFFSGCLVTDEIEFVAAMNHPAELLNNTPSNAVIEYSFPNELKEFSVTLWDPDERDRETYDGRITLVESINSASAVRNTLSCNRPTIEDAPDYEMGILVTFKCAITLRPLNPLTDLLLVEVEISDRGYLPGNELQLDANALRVQWTFSLLPTETL